MKLMLSGSGPGVQVGMMAKPKFPNVRCGKPGHPDQPGYAVCVHVAEQKAKPQTVIPPTAETLGQICCEILPSKHQIGALRLVCAYCVEANGWLADSAGTGGQVT